MSGAPEEKLGYAEELFAAFKKATPSAPDWYQLADYCIGVLMHEHVERLKQRVLDGNGREEK